MIKNRDHETVGKQNPGRFWTCTTSISEVYDIITRLGHEASRWVGFDKEGKGMWGACKSCSDTKWLFELGGTASAMPLMFQMFGPQSFKLS